MPLLLITGPANAAKAREVFGRLRARQSEDPLLVVPTAADVGHYRRELAEAGIVMGPVVTNFAGLMRELARAVGQRPRTISALARTRLIAHVVARARLEALRASASSPGFAASLGRFFAELRNARATPESFATAMLEWAGYDGGRRTYARELAGLYTAYDAALAELGRSDREQAQWQVLTALREQPRRWDGRPVLFYGWDDLAPVQRDAVETLAGPVGADVTLSLVFEPGRAAFASRAGLVAELEAGRDREHRRLGPLSEHYAPSARNALHHLERRLFEDEDGAPRVAPNGAVRLLETGGARAEAELVGAEVLELLQAGIESHELVVVIRGSLGERLAFAEILAGLGIPVAPEGALRLPGTALGAGVLALARAALPGGRADDLLRWLRTPGRLVTPADRARLDALERRIRRGEVADVATARRLWEDDTDTIPLAELDRVAAAAAGGGAGVGASGAAGEAVPAGAGEGVGVGASGSAAGASGGDEPSPLALLDQLAAELAATWTAPHARQAALLDAHGIQDARVARALAGARRQLAELPAGVLGGPDDVLAALQEVEVPVPDGTAGVLVTEPRAIRARRFRAVVVCGLQDGAFPRAPVPDPFLDDAERRALAKAGGPVLAPREEGIDRERFLFYACVSRPTDVLLLSFRFSDEEGEPEQASPFVTAVRELYSDELWGQRGRRLLSDVAWPPAAAPTPRELEQALLVAAAPEPPRPLGPPRSDAVRQLLAARQGESARGLETFAGCPVRWLVEQVLRPSPIDPDELPLRRGSLAHRAMERTLAILKERTGSARLTPERERDARDALATALRELRQTRALARGGPDAKILLRDLEAQLTRTLEYELQTGPGLEPEYLEWRFGPGEEAPPLHLEHTEVSGRIDRIDVDRARQAAIVRDYKGAAAPSYARWEEDGHLQVALYALAVQQNLGLTPVAGVYQPLRKPGDPRARGLVRDDLANAGAHFVDNDRVDPAAFDAALQAARAVAEQAARDIRAARIEACPQTCSGLGCAYPTICRGEPG